MYCSSQQLCLPGFLSRGVLRFVPQTIILLSFLFLVSVFSLSFLFVFWRLTLFGPAHKKVPPIQAPCSPTPWPTLYKDTI